MSGNVNLLMLYLWLVSCVFLSLLSRNLVILNRFYLYAVTLLCSFHRSATSDTTEVENELKKLKDDEDNLDFLIDQMSEFGVVQRELSELCIALFFLDSKINYALN